MEDSLARFEMLVRTDPLFAAEGMDLENGRRALDILEARCRPLEKAYTNGSLRRMLFFTRYPLARYAYPIDFLRSFITSEAARRDFLKAPTSTHAHALLASWRKAARAYTLDLRRYRKLHVIIAGLEKRDRNFEMEDYFGNRTTLAHALGIIDDLLRNAQTLVHEVDERAQVLAHGIQRNSKTSGRDLAPLGDFNLDDTARRIYDAEKKGGISPFRYAEIVDSYGPFSFTLTAFDGTPREHGFMWHVLKDRATSLRSGWLSVLSRHGFADIWNPKTLTDGVSRGAFASAVGISQEEMPYWYEPLAHFYNTRDLSYWSDIATNIDLLRRPDLDRVLVVRERSCSLDLLLAEAARDPILMRAHQIRRNRSQTAVGFSMLYDLMARSAPSLFYLVFNESVQRESVRSIRGERFEASDRGRLTRQEIEALSDDVLTATLSAARLREERGIAAGWL